MSTSPPPPLERVIHDLSVVRPWALRWAVGLGVFAALAAEPLNRSQLQEKLRADPVVSDQLVDYLMAIGYVGYVDGRLELTDRGTAIASLPAELYAPTSPMLMFDQAICELDTAWRSGAPVARRRELSYWDEVGRSSEASRVIGHYQPRSVQFGGSQLVETLLDLLREPGRSVLDLGGSNGALARDLAERHDGRIGVLDLPSMMVNAQHNVADLGEDRIDLHPGSFFDEVPTDYDVYVLNAILADYADACVKDLLLNLRRHIPAGALLVVSEIKIMYQDKYTQAETSLMLSLNTGGRQRSAHDVTELALGAGFEDVGKLLESEQRVTVVFRG